MRIECPHCAAAYDVPDSALSPGREVRCARCAHDWAPVPAPPPPPAPRRSATAPVQPVAALSVGQAPSRPEPLKLAREAAPDRGNLVLAWIASLLLVAAALAGLWVWREALAEAWPPLAWLYRALGA
ncbi:zinc-ribbon domain-containing protein [Pseudoroseomonas sp. WGS1072]|uniref:zinc-ribbon domain-containing protein n=1 Tax=Roseomonas sp. WGS1072 TaxID=3366816 RepID=UPI003BF138EE